MKQIELNLQKRLLIVELSRRMEYLLHKDELHFLLDGIHLHEIKYGKFELICKGSELTEEIAKDFVKNMIDNSEINFLYKNHRKNEKGFVFSVLKSFTSAIEAQGYYWGENPIKKPEMNPKSKKEIWNDAYQFEEWKEAESKTFNPVKTLIFEILL